MANNGSDEADVTWEARSGAGSAYTGTRWQRVSAPEKNRGLSQRLQWAVISNRNRMHLTGGRLQPRMRVFPPEGQAASFNFQGSYGQTIITDRVELVLGVRVRDIVRTMGQNRRSHANRDSVIRLCGVMVELGLDCG